MRYWTICYPGLQGEIVHETLSDQDIIKQYYPHWWGKMIEKYGQEEFDKTFSEKDCIDDWVVIHWATESTLEEIKQGKFE